MKAILRLIVLVYFFISMGSLYSLDCNNFKKLVEFANEHHYNSKNIDASLIKNALKRFIDYKLDEYGFTFR